MDTVAAQIERQRASLVGLLANLVRTPSPNPPGDTRAVADLIAARLREAAVDFQVLADEPRKPNIIARIGQGRPELLFTSHMDTAPAGDRRSWRHDPFAAEIVGARMFGRGAADAKASLVAMLAAVGALVEVLPLHGTLVFTAVSDEEVGGINGTEFLVDRGLVHPDHVVVGEITHNRLAVAEKGIVWMRVITHGRAAHGSTPWRAPTQSAPCCGSCRRWRTASPGGCALSRIRWFRLRRSILGPFVAGWPPISSRTGARRPSIAARCPTRTSRQRWRRSRVL